MIYALLLLLHPPLVPDAIDEAAIGLHAAIEDDLGGGDVPMTSIYTRDCLSMVKSDGRQWRVDWRAIDMLTWEENFIFIKSPGIQFAVVADAGKADQKAKLDGLRDAMVERTKACAPAETIAD